MLSYLKKTEKTAKSADEAKALALAELGVAEEDAIVEILDEGTKGFLGIGSKEARASAEIKDLKTYVAKLFLGQIFDAMKIKVDIEADVDGDVMNIELTGESMGVIIGKRGDTLDSLQYLTSLVVKQECGEYVKVMIDTENYREKRNNALVALAERLAEKVARSGRRYTLEPMNPYERRIIHASLQDNDKVTTFSVGEDPYRKIVISPKNPKPYYGRSSSYRRRNEYSGYAAEVQPQENSGDEE